ncbi:MAG: 50S ribosomal protein L11 methyltransferase [Candidatus Kapaibacteriota bacterium]|jgi:ribosomal protein L11 methyltransferase
MADEKYFYVKIESKEDYSDKLIAILSTFPILGVEEQNDTFIVSFTQTNWDSIDYDFFIESLRLADPNAVISEIESIEEKNWNEEWEKNLTPVIINERIAIVPPNRIGSTGKEIELVIEPKMSFGTGHHATTKLMITLAEKYVKPNSFWIDVGTGTGVLAILAKKLGAKEVLAIDNNSWAIQNAFENFKNNKVFEGIDLVEFDIDILPNLPVADGIFANLNYDIVVRNLKKFHSAIETTLGVAIVSGILIYDYDEFAEISQKFGFEIIETLRQEEWFAAVLKSGK